MYFNCFNKSFVILNYDNNSKKGDPGLYCLINNKKNNKKEQSFITLFNSI